MKVQLNHSGGRTSGDTCIKIIRLSAWIKHMFFDYIVEVPGLGIVWNVFNQFKT